MKSALPPPRDLGDLPYADYLEPFGGLLRPEAVHDTLHFDDSSFEDADSGSARFTECAFSSVTFTGGRLRRARFNDVWLHTARLVGTDLAETDWLDAEIVSGSLAGLEMFGAELRRVTFHQCKFDSVNFRTATLRDVAFRDCLLRDVDFGGASLTDTAFPGSDLDGVRFEKARLERTDLRGAVRLGITAGYGSLGGALIDTAQLLTIAPMLAQTLGITVRDHP
ncbi:pentapeptide repeat-containing protein [Streptomyces sp. F63]|uniref:pentapeptide repeat-containing protein n=1 Tax=Streptomyces sp. F63 TaxID=2824887 RepID=UPI001B37F580|nr:pentapeptide repeat-containing protein [Streptomyces sp. F63]MBQ0987939.1 pentapeptide repeat-containing protein [Streptomyces sp. F63]